jgi:S1-C subfamily serine protease
MRIPAALNLTVLATLLVLGGFAFGRAQAKDEDCQRRRTPVALAVAHAAPAVVSVEAFRAGRRSNVRSSGAGVIVHPEGYVVTNSHVVDGGQSFTVELFGDQGSLPAQLVANDPSGDLAVLKITRAGGFRHVSLCPARELMLGETAIAIGNPHGLGDTVTVGVVSALGRQAKMVNGVALRGLIQTDASINTGNSGGALLNLDGELIGINVSLLPSATGIAFAINSDQVGALLQRAVGRTPPPNALPSEKGVGAAPIRSGTAPTPSPTQAPRPTPTPTPTPAPTPRIVAPPRVQPAPKPAPRETTPLRPEDFGFSLEDDGARIVVSSVTRTAAAGIAGLHQGDVLLSIDGRPVESSIDILFAFSASRPGREYFLTIRRTGQAFDVVLVAPR